MTTNTTLTTVSTSNVIGSGRATTNTIIMPARQYISSINVKGTPYTIDLSEETKEQLYLQFLKKLGQAPIVAHKCHNCGGTVEMNEKKHIFVCPYCGSSYAVGVYMVNDRG